MSKLCVEPQAQTNFQRVLALQRLPTIIWGDVKFRCHIGESKTILEECHQQVWRQQQQHQGCMYPMVPVVQRLVDHEHPLSMITYSQLNDPIIITTATMDPCHPIARGAVLDWLKITLPIYQQTNTTNVQWWSYLNKKCVAVVPILRFQRSVWLHPTIIMQCIHHHHPMNQGDCAGEAHPFMYPQVRALPTPKMISTCQHAKAQLSARRHPCIMFLIITPPITVPFPLSFLMSIIKATCHLFNVPSNHTLPYQSLELHAQPVSQHVAHSLWIACVKHFSQRCKIGAKSHGFVNSARLLPCLLSLSSLLHYPWLNRKAVFKWMISKCLMKMKIMILQSIFICPLLPMMAIQISWLMTP